MIEVRETAVFSTWIAGLRDVRATARIDVRIGRLRLGNFGDAKSVGDGVSELRIDYGPGYRVYFARRGKVIVVLLCGGDKSTQGKDIKTAKALAKELRDESDND
jgi:putative addiction module killer protein